MNKYSCDFETTVDELDCRVWSWVIIDIDNIEFKQYGTNMTSFIRFCSNNKGIYYFHNLKFDGEFILHYILSQGYEFTKEKFPNKKQFNALISEQGQFYSIKINFGSITNEFRDSFKLLPFSVDSIAKGFNLPIKKLEIDYIEKRSENHQLTNEEKEYITNDALIIALALKQLFEQKFTKLTIGANALHFYKKQTGKQFKNFFPKIEYDNFIRKAYKGGFTYANPSHTNKLIGEGIVLDVNSLYPSVMHSPYIYPYGDGIYYEGEYMTDEKHPLYIQHLFCNFKIKKGKLPTIQLKNNYYFSATEYITDTDGVEVELYLTNIDLQLLKDQYNLLSVRYVDGYKFKAQASMFDNYIDYWYMQKTQAKKDNNHAMYIISKLMQNSLYGKFASSPEGKSKIPYIGEDKAVHYQVGEVEERNPLYIPVGCFVTSYARNVTIRSAQKCYARFLYADTDSLHLIGTEMPDIPIDAYKLGFWKHEGTFCQAKYLRAKMYMENIREPNESKYKWKITGSGMPDTCKINVNIDNFKIGSSFDGKLKPKHVKGGIILQNTPFTIREH